MRYCKLLARKMPEITHFATVTAMIPTVLVSFSANVVIEEKLIQDEKII